MDILNVYHVIAVSSTVTLAHVRGDGLFFMVDVMGQ